MSNDYEYDDADMAGGEIDIEVGDDLNAGGKFLATEGWFHMICTRVDMHPSKRDGTPIDNALARFHFEAIASSAPDQVGKIWDWILFLPKVSQKTGKINTKQRDRALIAFGLIQPQAGQKTKVNLMDAVARQVVVKIQANQPEGSSKTFYEMGYGEIYHPLDNAVAAFTWMDRDALQKLPESQKAIPSFTPKASPPTGAAAPVDYSDF